MIALYPGKRPSCGRVIEIVSFGDVSAQASFGAMASALLLFQTEMEILGMATRSLQLMAGMLALASAAHVQANEILCHGGKVKQINYHTGNGFMIQTTVMNAPVFFCNPGAAWYVQGSPSSTTPEECRALIAILTTAQLSGKTIGFVHFDGSNDLPVDCGSYAPWTKVNLRYIHFVD